MTGTELEEILGIVNLPSDTGQAQTNATHHLLELWWRMTSDVVEMCFDTTSTKTGIVKGTYSQSKKLTYLPCRHHIHNWIITLHFVITRNTSAVFQQAQSSTCSLATVIDAAKLSIIPVSHFNQSITKNEVTMQTLLQVVADHKIVFRMP